MIDPKCLCLYLLYFWGCSVYAVLAPFYPTEAIKKGMTVAEIGYLFSLYALIAFFFAPVSGKVMNKIGRKNVLLIGGIIESIGMLIFAFVIDLEGHAFIAFSIIARVFMGAGGSALLVTCFAVISNIYPEDMEDKIGIMETLGGVGLMAGPAIGGILYSLFGYKFVFIFYTLIFLVLTVISFKILPEDNPDDSKDSSEISYFKLLKLKKILLTLVVVIFGMAGPSFIEPVLADGLKEKLGLNELWIGIFFAFPTLGYTVAMKLLSMIPKYYDRRFILCTGLIIEGISFLLVGPWEAFGSPGVGYAVIALTFLGFGSAWAYIPSLPYLIDTASDEFINTDREAISNALSTLMGTTHYLGETVGPIIGGVSCHVFGYENVFAFFGMLILIYFIIYGVLAKVFQDTYNKKFVLDQEERKIDSNSLEIPLIPNKV